MKRHFSGFAVSFLAVLSGFAVTMAATTAPAQDEMNVQPVAENPVMLSDELLADGWISLFDGETMFGWREAGGPIAAFAELVEAPKWSVEDGALLGKAGMIYSTCQFGDYELSFQYRTPQPGVAGLLLHTSPKPSKKSYVVALNHRDPSVSDTKFAISSIGEIAGHVDATIPPQNPADESPDWHTMLVRAEGGKITVEIDLQTINEYTDPDPLGRGYIGFVCMGQLQLRDIRLRPLDMKPLFNGKDLEGWNTFPDLPTKATVTDAGELRIQDGNGMIETKESFDDFTFQTQVNIQSDNVNSGIFFRSIPGDKMNGYEAQVNNDMIDGDPTKPADCGTGGIFRRMDARQIVAGNREWFYMTIHADDKHIATWVNGVQVCDFGDFRDPDPNPRRGLRQEAGTIQIQGHDPTTDVLYRDMKITTIPERHGK